MHKFWNKQKIQIKIFLLSAFANFVFNVNHPTSSDPDQNLRKKFEPGSREPIQKHADRMLIFIFLQYNFRTIQMQRIKNKAEYKFNQSKNVRIKNKNSKL